MDVIEAIHSRRSIRAFRPQAVPRELIEALVWDAVQGPTPPGSGPEPCAFSVVEGAERIAAYGRAAKTHAQANRPPGKAAWVDNPDFHIFWDAPTLLVISGNPKNSEALADCVRAGQNISLSAHARGLGSCWVGSPMGWLAQPAVAAELGVPDGWTALAVIVLGYAREVPAAGPKARPQITWM